MAISYFFLQAWTIRFRLHNLNGLVDVGGYYCFIGFGQQTSLPFLQLKFSKQAGSVVTRYAEFSQRPDWVIGGQLVDILKKREKYLKGLD